VVLADAAYGNEAAFRDWLSEQQFDYVLGIRVTTQVWWGRISLHRSTPLRAGERACCALRSISRSTCWRWHARCRPSNGAA